MDNIKTIQEMIKGFYPYAKRRLGFNKPVRVFLKNDISNAEDPLGKTAYYDPGSMKIVLYTTNRHPKDVVRSFSHELVHHNQNCNGKFDHAGEMGEGYAQSDPLLREMEKEAYLEGNIIFRDGCDTGVFEGFENFIAIDQGEITMKEVFNKRHSALNKRLMESWGLGGVEEEVLPFSAEKTNFQRAAGDTGLSPSEDDRAAIEATFLKVLERERPTDRATALSILNDLKIGPQNKNRPDGPNLLWQRHEDAKEAAVKAFFPAGNDEVALEEINEDEVVEEEDIKEEEK